MMHQTRAAAVEVAMNYVLIADLLQDNPELFRALGDDGEPDLPTTVDEYFAWVLDRNKHLFRLPETDDRIVNRDERLVGQITALIEATIANVISTVDFPEDPEGEINASRLRHPAVQGRLARGLAALIPSESGGGDDALEA